MPFRVPSNPNNSVLLESPGAVVDAKSGLESTFQRETHVLPTEQPSRASCCNFISIRTDHSEIYHPSWKQGHVSGFGRNFDLKPIWNGHVLEQVAIRSCPSCWQRMTQTAHPWLLLQDQGLAQQHTQMSSSRIIQSSSTHTLSLQLKYDKDPTPPRQIPNRKSGVHSWKESH